MQRHYSSHHHPALAGRTNKYITILSRALRSPTLRPSRNFTVVIQRDDAVVYLNGVEVFPAISGGAISN